MTIDRLAARVIAALTERTETVATAESVTAGLVSARLTDVPGASAVVRGGVIVYATELKTTLAGVDEKLLTEHGAVHPEVARQLADGARSRCSAAWGIGVTGVAGPSEQDGVPQGVVHCGLSGVDVRTVRTLRFSGDRSAVRVASVEAALKLLAEHID